MKAGDKIKLKSGKEFVLPWTPVKSTGGKGAARKWHGVTDEMWEQLFEALQPYSTKERDEICLTIDAQKYGTLNKTYGDNPTLGVNKDRTVVSRKTSQKRDLSVLEKMALLNQQEEEAERVYQAEMTRINNERATLAGDPELEKIKEQIAALEKMR